MEGPTEANIIELHLRHLTQDEIATTLRVGHTRVARAIREFRCSGTIPNCLRIGRPRKMTSDLAAFVEARTIQQPTLSARGLANEIDDHFGVKLSPTTINTVRGNLRFKYRPPRHNQIVTASHAAARIAFCDKMLAMPEVLPRIHFSDESRVVLGDDKGWIWYRAGEDNPAASVASGKFPPSVMIFAVIGMGYKSDLLMVEGTIDAERYIQNLDSLGFIATLDRMHGPFGWIFQQDGAPSHTSQVALDWLEESVDVIVDWPANSPDLSPIELLWAILKKLVRRMKPQTIEEVKGALLAAWSMIPQATIDGLCRGFQARLDLCLANRGESISNQLWQVTDRYALKTFFEANTVHQPWTEDEDAQLLHDYLDAGPRWTVIAKRWTTRSPTQLKNRWYRVLRHRLHDPADDAVTLAGLLGQARRRLPVPRLAFG
jgi:transposase